MDSLLANYAYSDDEEQPCSPPPPPHRIPLAKPVKSGSKAEEENDESILPKSTSQRGGIFTSLPPPKSSIFSSILPPKSMSFLNPISQPDDGDEQTENPKSKPSSTSLFSSLPLPKSSSSSSSSSAVRKVIQFRPPVIVKPTTGSFSDDDEDSDEGEQERKKKKSRESISAYSATSFLCSIPAPRHSATLGSLSSASGRRSMLETDSPASTVNIAGATRSDSVMNSDQSNEMNYGYSISSSKSENHAYYIGNGSVADGNVGSAPESSISMGSDAGMNHLYEIYDHPSSLGSDSSVYYGYYAAGPTDASGVGMAFNAGSYEGADHLYGNGEHVGNTNSGGSYGDYGNNEQYENNLANTTALPEVSCVVEHALPVPGKRGKKDIPPHIIEVKQDELMKNRPREDQVKLTGIAFGPAYQPASTKGKPTKLHKRKHQIGSLYFDMRQKEMELTERRAKGFLTKAQTQAKYGW